MKPTVAYHLFCWQNLKRKIFENIRFLQAALVPGQNTYTRRPLADTPGAAKDDENVFGYLKSQFPYSYNETNNITEVTIRCFCEECLSSTRAAYSEM
jgi:hypothetical protein